MRPGVRFLPHAAALRDGVHVYLTFCLCGHATGYGHDRPGLRPVHARDAHGHRSPDGFLVAQS
eukprot:7285329-Pyramimonas_sp.AAC.1